MNPESDHDILIELRGEVKGLRQDVTDMRDNTKTILVDHETRLRFLERWAWGAIGIIGVAEAVLAYYIQHK